MMQKPDETSTTSNNSKNSIPYKKRTLEDKKKKDVLEGKKKLLEIYVFVSALIIASIQTTTSLIAVNTSINEAVYKSTVLYVRGIVGLSNISFFFFIFLLILYYTKVFDEQLPFTAFLITSISIFFSIILTNFIDLQINFSFSAYMFLFVLLFIAIFFSLLSNSILILELESKYFKLESIFSGFMLRTFKTTSLGKSVLTIWHRKDNIWKLILFVTIFYVIYFILMAIIYWKNMQLYTEISSHLNNPCIDMTIILWTITVALVVYFMKIFIKL